MGERAAFSLCDNQQDVFTARDEVRDDPSPENRAAITHRERLLGKTSIDHFPFPHDMKVERSVFVWKELGQESRDPGVHLHVRRWLKGAETEVSAQVRGRTDL